MIGKSRAPISRGEMPHETLLALFPSIGAVNPAPTAPANSLRVGDHLLERMA